MHLRCTSLGLAEACDEIIHIVSLGFILTPLVIFILYVWEHVERKIKSFRKGENSN